MLGADAERRFLLSDLGTEFAVYLIAKFFISVFVALTDCAEQSADNVTEGRGGMMLGSITFCVLCVIKLHGRFDNNIFDTAELFIIFKRNIRCFLFVVERKFLTVNLIPLGIKFGDVAVLRKLGNNFIYRFFYLFR